MTEAEFLQKYLPPNATSANDVLYDFDQKCKLTPSTQFLEEICVDLLPFLQAVKFTPELYESGFEACELVLSFLSRAKSQNTILPQNDTVDLIIREGLRMIDASKIHRVLLNNDATKRIISMLYLFGTDIEVNY